MLSVRRLVAVVAATVVAASVGATAYAAIPDARTGVFNGCVNNTTGVLRVIDPAKGQSCVTKRGPLQETSIQWNRTGPAGPAGPAGPVGPAGSGGAAKPLTNTRTASATLTDSQPVVVAAACDTGDVPVNGYWTVDGQSGISNQAVFYSLGVTGETATGYQVSVGRNSGYTGADPKVIATVVCLDVA